MVVQEVLNIAAALISIIGGPISVYFSWKAASKAGKAVAGANELAKRMTSRALYDHVGEVIEQKDE